MLVSVALILWTEICAQLMFIFTNHKEGVNITSYILCCFLKKYYQRNQNSCYWYVCNYFAKAQGLVNISVSIHNVVAL